MEMITLTMITLTFAILSLKERCYTVTNFFFFGGGRVGKNWHTPPSSITLALHNVFEDRNAEGEHDMTITPLHRIEIW